MATKKEKRIEATSKELNTRLEAAVKKARGKADKPKAEAPVIRAARYPASAIITLTPKGKERNWKRPGSDAETLYDIYLKNPKNLTVGKYVELAGKTKRPKAGRTAINWDVAHKYITVSSK